MFDCQMHTLYVFSVAVVFYFSSSNVLQKTLVVKLRAVATSPARHFGSRCGGRNYRYRHISAMQFPENNVKNCGIWFWLNSFWIALFGNSCMIFRSRPISICANASCHMSCTECVCSGKQGLLLLWLAQINVLSMNVHLSITLCGILKYTDNAVTELELLSLPPFPPI